MSKESKEIREIIDDIGQIINESYTFRSNSENNILPENDEINSELEREIKPDNISLNKPKVGGIDNEVKEIRKIALSVISNISPNDDQESYKLVKGIWDSCDKFLTRDTKEIKTKNENNIN